MNIILILLSLTIFILTFWVAVGITKRITTFNTLLSLPIALSLLIVIQFCLLNMLSLVGAVTPIGVAFAEILVILSWVSFNRPTFENIKKQIQFDLSLINKNYNKYFFMMLPICMLLSYISIIYPPNNFDSMTYHMARVAHWIQNQSVAYYETSNASQNVMGPGAEYLILILQIISKSDVLANSVQCFSYIILALSIGEICNHVGIYRRIIPYIAIITLSTPMALMQATSTQIDLVTSVLAVSNVILFYRLINNTIYEINMFYLLLIGITSGAAFITKPTALLVFFPFCLVIFCIHSLRYKNVLFKLSYLFRLSIPVYAFIFSIFPDAIRKFLYTGSVIGNRHEVYHILSDWSFERFHNIVCAAFHHSPLSPETNSMLSQKFHLYTPRALPQMLYKSVFAVHEDSIGNPIQFLTALIFIVLFLPLFLKIIRQKSIFQNSYALAICPIFSFIMIPLFVYNNPWFSRTQLPAFFMLPFLFVLLSNNLLYTDFYSKLIIVLIKIVAFISFCYAILCIPTNLSRPLSTFLFFHPNTIDREQSYYSPGNKLQKIHDAVIAAALNYKFTHIGLIISDNTYDYPITWRAMQLNLKATHIPREGAFPYIMFKETDWPEIILSEIGIPYYWKSYNDWVQVSEDVYINKKKIEKISPGT